MFLLQTGQASTGGCSGGHQIGAPPASTPPLRLPEMSAQHPAGKSGQRRGTHPGTGNQPRSKFYLLQNLV